MQEIIMLGTITHSSSIYKDVWNVLEMSDMWRAKYHSDLKNYVNLHKTFASPPKKTPKKQNKQKDPLNIKLFKEV